MFDPIDPVEFDSDAWATRAWRDAHNIPEDCSRRDDEFIRTQFVFHIPQRPWLLNVPCSPCPRLRSSGAKPGAERQMLLPPSVSRGTSRRPADVSCLSREGSQAWFTSPIGASTGRDCGFRRGRSKKLTMFVRHPVACAF